VKHVCEVFETVTITIANQDLELHPLKAIYHEVSGSLICSDIHIGKAGHFRTQGIPISRMVNSNNAWNLTLLFEQFPLKRLVVVGDLVHSRYNEEWADFVDFLASFPALEKVLIAGNHDVHAFQFLLEAGFQVHAEWTLGELLFTHEPTEREGFYNISGHLHPAVVLSGKGRQHLKLPCFYFGNKGGVMPAFGTFTGTKTIKPSPGERVFVIANQRVVEVS
jgi:DNA ligase-associated metallophosphoesterase